MQQQLKVGDKVYHQTRWGMDIYTIDKVTNTLAIVEYSRKFDINYYNPKHITCIGDESGSYQLETPELKAKLLKVNAISIIKRIDFNKLPIETLQAITTILTKLNDNDKAKTY